MNHSHTKALIAMGGNLGNVSETFNQAVELLSKVDQIEVTSRSSNYSTQPVGNDAGERFINGAVAVHTSLTPIQLLDQLQNLENELGRVRNLHWGPRAIDLDLILYGAEIIESKRLIVPHPATFYRRFVLDPATEIAGEWSYPIFQESLSTVRERLLILPLQVCVFGDQELLRKLRKQSIPNQKMEFCAEPRLNTAIILDCSGNQTSPQAISLADIADRFTFANHILLAATDEPHRIAAS